MAVYASTSHTDPDIRDAPTASGLLVAFDEWQALRGAWAGLPARLIPDIPCPPEDIYPDDHGVVLHIDNGETSIS